MIVFLDQATKVEVDLWIATGEPEATVCEGARRATVFGTRAPVATLEQLLLLYLYSNQPKHLGDFAAIVTSTRADLAETERTLASIHPEMLGEWRKAGPRRPATAAAAPETRCAQAPALTIAPSRHAFPAGSAQRRSRGTHPDRV